MLWNLLGELVAPSRCAACDLRVPGGTLFCPPCSATVEPSDPWSARGGCLAAFEYGGAIATAIARLKYEDRPDLAPRFAAALVRTARAFRDAVDLVVPVPLHAQRLADRGYNQAALLAAPVARSLSVRLAARGLLRLRDTPRQTSLDRATRLSNVARAFRARDPSIRGSRVLLVDDVRTTGATLDDCATALHEVGAGQVVALVLARRR